MANKTVNVDDFAAELVVMITEVADEEKANANLAVIEAAKIAKEKVKETPPPAPVYRDWGDYSSGWRMHVETSYTGDITATIAQSKRKAHLTHLLEKGHVLANGHGRARAFPHVAPAADAAFEELERRLRK